MQTVGRWTRVRHSALPTVAAPAQAWGLAPALAVCSGPSLASALALQRREAAWGVGWASPRAHVWVLQTGVWRVHLMVCLWAALLGCLSARLRVSRAEALWGGQATLWAPLLLGLVTLWAPLLVELVLLWAPSLLGLVTLWAPLLLGSVTLWAPLWVRWATLWAPLW